MKSETGGERNVSPWERFVPLVPPILLCLVAATQVWLTRATELTPWRGGGFGMFSTTDTEFRHLRIRVDGHAEAIDLPLPVATGETARVARAFPTRGRIEALGDLILELERVDGRDVRRVEIQVLRLRYDEETMEPRFEVVREHVVEAR